MLGIGGDDRHRVVVHAVPVGVDSAIIDLDIRRVADHRDRILVGVVIRDDVYAEAVDPVVVDIGVFARNTGPIYGAVVVDVFENDVLLRID